PKTLAKTKATIKSKATTSIAEAEKLAELFSALAEPTRIRLLSLLLQNGETCVCDLVDATGLEQTNVSRHLAKLRTVGLISGRKSGLWVYYSIMNAEDGMQESVLELIEQAAGKLPGLKLDLVKLKACNCETC
ncbi:MAG: metalloregulator ArsR/SmtB family transcription factor, partial [Candidatus Kapaibacterium sp.]